MGSETENSSAKDYCDSGLVQIKRRKDVFQNSVSCSSFRTEKGPIMYSCQIMT